MIKMRLAILGAAAMLALGSASALAMTETIGAGDSDAHGDAVASAARNCPHGAGGVHGACVSAVAHANKDSHEGGAQSQQVKDCKAANPASDKAGHRAFAACASGHTETAAAGS